MLIFAAVLSCETKTLVMRRRRRARRRLYFAAAVCACASAMVTAAAIAPALDVGEVVAATVDRVPDPNAYRPDLRWGYRRGHPSFIQVVEVDGIPVEATTASAFLRMRAAAAESGVELGLASGFRGNLKQLGLYLYWRFGAGNKAARPGRSNHQSGRALDLIVGNRATRRWLYRNGKRFGFKRTVRGEPWHWEYIHAPSSRKAVSRARRGRAWRARYAKRRRARRLRARRARRAKLRRARLRRARARRAKRKRARRGARGGTRLAGK